MSPQCIRGNPNLGSRRNAEGVGVEMNRSVASILVFNVARFLLLKACFA